MGALVFEPGLGEFLIFAVGDHAGPIGLTRDLVDLPTDFGLGTHPLDLLPEGLKDADVVFLIGNADWDYLGLIVERAAQAGHGDARKDLAACGVVALVDAHKSFSVSIRT